MKIQVYRNSSPTIELRLEDSIYTDVLMGENNLVFSFSDTVVLDIHVGDYLIYKGQRMEINIQPEVGRDHKLDYIIQFDGLRHRLSRYKIKDEGALTFSYFGDLTDYMSMFLESINGVDSGWTVGELDEVEPFAVEFDKVDHLIALNMICEACKCEWQINGQEITIKETVGTFHEYPLEYGKDNGLYKITRQSLQTSGIITRAYAVGGTQNLAANYPYKQLTLPDYYEDDEAVALFGIREGVFEDLDIFPKRTSTATAVGQINDSIFTITDSTIDFDLDGQRIDGEEAYIVFKSGMLNGQQFKILSYNHTSKTIRYEANKDSNGNLLPFGAVVAEVGDEYTLIGIRMPAAYETAALNELAEKREEYVNTNKVPRVVYDAQVDPLDLKRNNKQLKAGDILPFIDTKIGLDDNLRITKISYTGTYPVLAKDNMRFDIEIGQEVSYTRFQKIESDIKQTKQIVTQYSKQSFEYDRRNLRAINEFKDKVFDPDEKLQQTLVQGIAALFGSESMYFDLEDVELSVNASGDENRLIISTGKLIHQQYEIAGLGYIWNLTALDQDNLEPLRSYYLAAKVSRTALTGEWVLSESQLATESEAGYYYFNLGVLSSVIEGQRSFNPTRMFTLISGGSVLTDVVTTRLINVQKLFAQEIVAENFWLKLGKIGIFDVLNGYIQTSAWSDADNAGGVRFTNNGILSRNASEQLFPTSSGLDYAGSLVGLLNQTLPSSQSTFGEYARAGIMGMNYNELDTQAFNQMMWTWGQYGVLASSLKVLGGVELPARIEEGSGSVTISKNDYHVIIAGSHTGAVFPSIPNHGKILVVKNARNVNITLTASHNFVLGDNTQSLTAIIPGGKYRTYQFVKPIFTSGYWFEIGTVV